MLHRLFSLFMGRPTESYRYRAIRRLGGWEPQMSYTAGTVDGVVWYPLNAEGYWLEPKAFSSGNPRAHIAMTKAEAGRAITRARAINGQHIAVAGGLLTNEKAD